MSGVAEDNSADPRSLPTSSCFRCRLRGLPRFLLAGANGKHFQTLWSYQQGQLPFLLQDRVSDSDLAARLTLRSPVQYPIVSESMYTPGQTLAKVPIFSGLTENELSFLAQRAVPRHYSTGESVFGEGEPCSGLYVVESGHVRIFKRSANGRERVLSIDGPGSSFAGLPVFRWRKLPGIGNGDRRRHPAFCQQTGFSGIVSSPSSCSTEGHAGGRYYRRGLLSTTPSVDR